MTTECDKLSLLFEEHSAGSLGAEEKAAVDRHLETCAACRKEYAELTAVARRLRAIPPPKVPDAVFDRLVKSLGLDEAPAPARPRLRLIPRMAWGAIAAVLVVGLSIGLYFRPGDEAFAKGKVFVAGGRETVAGKGGPPNADPWKGDTEAAIELPGDATVKAGDRVELWRGGERFARGRLTGERRDGRWIAKVNVEAGGELRTGDEARVIR